MFLALAIQFLSLFAVTKIRIEDALNIVDLRDKLKDKPDFKEERKRLQLDKDTVIFFKDFQGYWPEPESD